MTITDPTVGKPVAAWFTDVTNGVNAANTEDVDYSASFVITATTTNPTKGASTYVAKYQRLASGFVHVEFCVTIGAGYGAGSGYYLFSLPPGFTATTPGGPGGVYVLDSGTTPRYGGTLILYSSTQMWGGFGTSPIAHNSPQTWATGDEIRGSMLFLPV
jgi:hypothetical protein